MTSSLLFLGDIGGSELILIMVVILIFFGANKIPELARGLGKGIREFKDASSEIRNEFENAGQNRPNQYPNQQQYPNPYPPQQTPYDPSQPSYQQPQYGHVPPATTSYEPVPPVYNAQDDVNSPAAAHRPPHAHDTPLPSSVPGTRPRLDQPSPDA